MTIISKTAGALSLASCMHDIHKTALINSNNAYAKASSNAVISSSIGNQKSNKISYRDAQRKNWLAQNNFSAPIKETSARIFGYITGFLKASVRYIPNFILSAIAICAKSPDSDKKTVNIANIATIALGVVEALDFIKNGTNLHQRTDYLE